MTDKPISEDDLHAYIDGALDEARRAEIASYLHAHPDIAARFGSYAGQRSDLRTAFAAIADEPIPTRLNLAHMIDMQRRPHVSRWWATAAAILLLAIGGSGGWLLREMTSIPQEGVGALAREASANFSAYASDTVRPVEIRADKATELADWAAERMGRRPVLPDLSKAGYRLMGGRVVSTPHSPALMLMYDDDRGGRLVMLTRPMAVDQDRAMAAHSEGKVDGWTWASRGMGYSLVGSMPAETLHPLADDIRKQVLGNI
ncbi:anti-sigma factor [Labrys sp. La1]|uniref:anti-sigma factor family protein n=1 Tax=Labrys sp. La1 TaxID=3404917 RepID=UPI003EBE4E8B